MTITGKGLLLRVKKIDTVIFRSEPEIALPVSLDGDDGITAGVGNGRVYNGGELAGFWMEQVEARLGSYPEGPVLVRIEAKDTVIAEGAHSLLMRRLMTNLVKNLMTERMETPGLYIEEIEPSARGGDPKASRLVFNYRGNIIGAETVFIGFAVLVPEKMVGGPVQSVQAIGCPYPEPAGPVLIDTLNIAVAEAIAVGLFIPVNDHLISVVPVEAVPGADPDKTQAIL